MSGAEVRERSDDAASFQYACSTLAGGRHSFVRVAPLAGALHTDRGYHPIPCYLQSPRTPAHRPAAPVAHGFANCANRGERSSPLKPC